MSSYDEIEFTKMSKDCVLFLMFAILLVICILIISYIIIKNGC